jgi:hypothetical protein
MNRIHSLGLHPTGFDVWFVSIDGTGLARIADLGDADPSLAFSADGSRLYVLGVSGLYRVGVASREVVRLPSTLSNGQIVRLP